MHDIAPILTALALVLSAIPAIIAAIVSLHTAKRVTENTKKIEEVRAVAVESKDTAERTHDAVNSKMDKLLVVVEDSARAKGNLEGRAEAAAEQSKPGA